MTKSIPAIVLSALFFFLFFFLITFGVDSNDQGQFHKETEDMVTRRKTIRPQLGTVPALLLG